MKVIKIILISKDLTKLQYEVLADDRYTNKYEIAQHVKKVFNQNDYHHYLTLRNSGVDKEEAKEFFSGKSENYIGELENQYDFDRHYSSAHKDLSDDAKFDIASTKLGLQNTVDKTEFKNTRGVIKDSRLHLYKNGNIIAKGKKEEKTTSQIMADLMREDKTTTSGYEKAENAAKAMAMSGEYSKEEIEDALYTHLNKKSVYSSSSLKDWRARHTKNLPKKITENPDFDKYLNTDTELDTPLDGNFQIGSAIQQGASIDSIEKNLSTELAPEKKKELLSFAKKQKLQQLKNLPSDKKPNASKFMKDYITADDSTTSKMQKLENAANEMSKKGYSDDEIREAIGYANKNPPPYFKKTDLNDLKASFYKKGVPDKIMKNVEAKKEKDAADLKEKAENEKSQKTIEEGVQENLDDPNLDPNVEQDILNNAQNPLGKQQGLLPPLDTGDGLNTLEKESSSLDTVLSEGSALMKVV